MPGDPGLSVQRSTELAGHESGSDCPRYALAPARARTIRSTNATRWPMTSSRFVSLKIFGDRWSLLVLRDIMFGNRRNFRELQAQSEEGIAYPGRPTQEAHRRGPAHPRERQTGTASHL